jgi:hypothetical protein
MTCDKMEEIANKNDPFPAQNLVDTFAKELREMLRNSFPNTNRTRIEASRHLSELNSDSGPDQFRTQPNIIPQSIAIPLRWPRSRRCFFDVDLKNALVLGVSLPRLNILESQFRSARFQ